MSIIASDSPNPQPVPASATAELALAAVNALRSELAIQSQAITTRFEAMDKAATILHEDSTRVPTQIDREISRLRELTEARFHEHDRVLQSLQIQIDTRIRSVQDIIEARIPAVREAIGDLYRLVNEAVQKEVASLDGRVNVVVATAEEQVRSIQMQFALLKQATEQLDVANKTAIAAALQAQKESAGETQKTSQAAIAKSEASTSEAIKALRSTFDIAIVSLTERFSDLRGRMDRGEGKSTATDPALILIAEQVRDLSKSRDTSSGMGYMVVTGISIMVALISMGVAVFHIVK